MRIRAAVLPEFSMAGHALPVSACNVGLCQTDRGGESRASHRMPDAKRYI